MLWLFFSSILEWGTYITYIAKIATKIIGAFIRSMKFFRLRLHFITKNLPYSYEKVVKTLK